MQRSSLRSIRSRKEALDYLSWSFMWRRLVQSSYYGLEDVSDEGVSEYLFISSAAFSTLRDAGCVKLDVERGDDVGSLVHTPFGSIASNYYVT